jgi:hypothetical protein
MQLLAEYQNYSLAADSLVWIRKLLLTFDLDGWTEHSAVSL